MTKFEKLLAELQDDGTAEVRKSWAPVGSPEAVTAEDRRAHREALRNSARSDLEKLQRDYWASRRRSMARLKNKVGSVLSPMIKALKLQTDEMAASPAMLQINQANQYHAARNRLAEFNRKFTAEVTAGSLTAEETAKVEMATHRHAQALDEIGRKLGII